MDALLFLGKVPGPVLVEVRVAVDQGDPDPSAVGVTAVGLGEPGRDQAVSSVTLPGRGRTRLWCRRGCLPRPACRPAVCPGRQPYPHRARATVGYAAQPIVTRSGSLLRGDGAATRVEGSNCVPDCSSPDQGLRLHARGASAAYLYGRGGHGPCVPRFLHD